VPFTPFHFGPGAFIALSLRKYIDLPVLVLANVVIDFELSAIMLFGLNYLLDLRDILPSRIDTVYNRSGIIVQKEKRDIQKMEAVETFYTKLQKWLATKKEGGHR